MDAARLAQARQNAADMARLLTKEDIAFLIQYLYERADAVRYPAFLLLKARSVIAEDVCPYWEEVAALLEDKNSYRRNIALWLIAENVRWAGTTAFKAVYPTYMARLQDEKFITVRQAIQAIPAWVPYAPALAEQTAQQLLDMPLTPYRDSQRPLILADRVAALMVINRLAPSERVRTFILDAITGGMLDSKRARAFKAELDGELGRKT